MSKPRNKTNRRRLHYMGVLAAAGLLTVGAAGPVMAQANSYNATPIDSSNPATDGADIVGGPVDWDAGSGNGADTIGGTGLNYTANALVDIVSGTTATTHGITVQDGVSAVLDNSANADIVSTGNVSTGTGDLTVNIGTGSFTNTGNNMSGTVTLNNKDAASTNTGKLAGVDLTLTGGDTTIEGITDSANTINGSGKVTNNTALTEGALTLSGTIAMEGSGTVSGKASIIAENGTSFKTSGAVSGGTITGKGDGSITLTGGVSGGDIESESGDIAISNGGGTGLSGGTVESATGAITIADGMSGGSVNLTGAGSLAITGGVTGGSVTANNNATDATVDTVNATVADVNLTGVTVDGDVNSSGGNKVTADASTLNRVVGGDAVLKNASVVNTLSGGTITADGADSKIGAVDGSSTIQGNGAATDALTLTGNIGSSTGDMVLNVGGASAVTLNDNNGTTQTIGNATNKTTINLNDGSTANLANVNVVAGEVALNNERVDADASKMVVGKATGDAVVTAKNATVSGLESATLISNTNSVVTGAISGANNIIKALNNGDDVVLANVTIGQGGAPTDLTIGGDGKNIDVTLAGTTKIQGVMTRADDSTKITLAAGALASGGELNWSTVNLDSGGRVEMANESGETFKIGTISNGTVLTAKAMDVMGMAGGTLVVDGTDNVLDGTVTGANNAIYGKTNTGDDVLTLGDNLTIGETGGGTSLVVGKDGSKVTVKDGATSPSIVGATGTGNTTSIKAGNGSTVDFGNTNLAGGNFEIGTIDTDKGSQMTVGDLGDSTDVKDTSVAVDGSATAGTVLGTGTTIKGSDATGTNELVLADNVSSTANGGNTALNIDGTSSNITVKTDSVTGDETNGMTINVAGEGAALTGTTAGKGTDLNGTVTANVSNKGTATFGDIDGVDDKVTLNATDNGSIINTGNISGGAQVTANADGGEINIGDVSGSGTKLDAVASNTGGLVTIKDVTDNAVVNATGQGGGKVTVNDVDNATVNAIGDVEVGGTQVDTKNAIDVDSTLTVTADVTGNTYYYAIDSTKGPEPDNNADPMRHNVVIDGATLGGSSTRKTEVTFGANKHPSESGYGASNLGAVNVTDSTTGGTIDGSGMGTTINIVGKTVFDLANTIVKNGETTFNINNDDAQATIGGQENSTILASTDKTGGATLTNAGNVLGTSKIEKGSSSAGNINYEVEGSIGGGADRTDFTIGNGVNVEANNINGGSNGTQVTIASGGALDQAQGLISGDVTVVTNTSNATKLGQMQNGSTLHYSAINGAGATTVAGTADGATSTIDNNNASGGGALTIAGVGANSNTIYTGQGNTTIDGTGSNATTTIQEGGTATLADIGSGHKLQVNDGTAVLNSGIAPGNLQTVGLNSANGDSTLTNNTGTALVLANGLDARVGAGDVVINTGSGLSLSGDVNVTGSGTGAFKVAGTAINMNNNNLNAAGSVNFDFGNAATGFSSLNALNTANGTKVAFANKQGYLDAKTANVNGATVYDSNLAVGASGTANNTIYADTLNVNEALGVTGALTIAQNANLNLNAAAGYANGGTAITVDGSVSIAQGTTFNVTGQDQAKAASFQVVNGTNVGRDQWANLSYAGGNGYDTTGNVHFYDWTTGYYDFVRSDGVHDAVTGAPKYGQRYVNALMGKNARLAYHLGTQASNEEITMAMGNTLNAALMMVSNPLDPIMKNLNTLHPQAGHALATSAGECETYGLWVTPNFSFRSVDGNYGRGYGDIDIKSYGVTLGGDAWVNEQFRVGGFFAINSSELDGDFQDIDGDDFQVGAYGQAVLGEGVMLNVGMAYGWQSYDASRKVYIAGQPNASQRIKSDFDANTLSFVAEVNKTFALDYGMYARPSISYTYLGTELDSYREKSNLASDSPWNLAQRVGSTDFDLHLFRVGTDIGWTNENSAVIGRVYYVGNAGDDQPENTARFLNAAPVGTPSFKIYGAEYDDSMANLGLTLKVAPTVNTHVAIDYDALLGSNSETHNVNLSFKYEW